MTARRRLPSLLIPGSLVLLLAACSSLPLIGSDEDGKPATPNTQDASAPSTGGGTNQPVTNDGGVVLGSADGEPHKSGSRLKMRFLEGADGSRQFTSWTDTARDNEECSFALHADGTQRCMPITTIFAHGYYATSACSFDAQVGYAAKGAVPSGAAKYALAFATSGTHRFPITGPRKGTVFAKNGAGACVEVTSSASEYDLYDLGPEIPTSAFVVGVYKTEP